MRRIQSSSILTILGVLAILAVMLPGSFWYPAEATDPTIITSDTTLGDIPAGETVIISSGVKVTASGLMDGTLINNGILVVDGFTIRGTLTNNEGGILVQYPFNGLGIVGGTLNNAGLMTVYDHVSTQPQDNPALVNNLATGIIPGGSWINHGLAINNEGIIACVGFLNDFDLLSGHTPICNSEQYSKHLVLFEGTDFSDGVVNLNQPLRVIALNPPDAFEDEFGNIIPLDNLTIKWINPDGDTVRESSYRVSTGYDSFAPNEIGTWTIVAEFSDGTTITKNIDVSFNLIPESPIGSIAAVVSSAAALGAFVYFRQYRYKAVL